MLQTLLPFAVGLAASYAGTHLSPQVLLYCAGLTASFGAGYWVAKKEKEEKEVEEPIKSEPVEDIQPYDSDNTDEFYAALDGENLADTYTDSNEMSKISNKILKVGVLNVTKDMLHDVNM